MRYQTLLFDLDGTLLDFDKAENIALEGVLTKYVTKTNDEIKKCYQTINSELWKQLELGKIDKETVFNTRFGRLLQTLGIDCDKILAKKINREYLDNLEGIWIKGAEEICQVLSKTHDLYIVTNGEEKTQNRKIKEMGLQKYVKKVYISETIGKSKPKKEYFDYVFKDIENFEIAKTLIIGDRLSSDIKGGNNAGIDTCWYNPNKKLKTEEVTITYEIQDLRELLKIV